MSSTHVIPYTREVQIERTVQIIECANCSVDFGIGANFMAARRRDNETFYCPNGHSNYYKPGKSPEQKLREAEARETALQDQVGAAVRDAEAARRALLRDRERFANGVCPCCNRSFENVRRHMASKHPDYDVTKVQQPSTLKFACTCGRSFQTVRGLQIHQARSRYEGWDLPKNSWRGHLTSTEPAR